MFPSPIIPPPNGPSSDNASGAKEMPRKSIRSSLSKLGGFASAPKDKDLEAQLPLPAAAATMGARTREEQAALGLSSVWEEDEDDFRSSYATTATTRSSDLRETQIEIRFDDHFVVADSPVSDATVSPILPVSPGSPGEHDNSYRHEPVSPIGGEERDNRWLTKGKPRIDSLGIAMV